MHVNLTVSVLTRVPDRLGARRTQRGFSLLEILITMLIVAVGSLGLAGVITTGLRATHGAAERTVATQLASGFIDMMETNAWGKLHTTGNPANPYGQVYMTPFQGVFSYPACYPGSACGLADLRLVHLVQFRDAVRAALPRGDIQVSATGVSPASIAVTVAWFDQSATNDVVTGCTSVNPAPPSTVNQCLTLYLTNQ